MRNFKDLSRALASIAAGLKGIKDIIDTIEPGGGSGSGVVYSTTEHKIGTWVDGSDLYEIAIIEENVASSSSKQTIDITDLIAESDVIFVNEVISIGSTSTVCGPYFGATTDKLNAFINTSTNTIDYYDADWPGDVVFNIRYTKKIV